MNPEPVITEPEPPVAEVPVQKETTTPEPAEPTSMDTEPVETVQPEPDIQNEPEHVQNEPEHINNSRNTDKIPVEIVGIEPVNFSKPEPVTVNQPEPVKPVEIKTAPVIVIELEPAQMSRVESIVIPKPVIIEEVSEHKPDDEPASLFSEAELNKKDIGKVTEKLVNKAKIKKIKTKQAVTGRPSISDPSINVVDSAEEKEKMEVEHHEETILGSKARKRPLEDASLDWTTEGQRKLMLKCSMTIILLVFIIACLAYSLLN